MESFGVLFDFECGLNSTKEKDRDIGVCCGGEFENLREHVFVFGNTRLGNVHAEVFALQALDTFCNFLGTQFGARMAVRGLVSRIIQAVRGHRVVSQSCRFLFKKATKNTALDEVQLELGEADCRGRLVVHMTKS